MKHVVGRIYTLSSVILTFIYSIRTEREASRASSCQNSVIRRPAQRHRRGAADGSSLWTMRRNRPRHRGRQKMNFKKESLEKYWENCQQKNSPRPAMPPKPRRGSSMERECTLLVLLAQAQLGTIAASPKKRQLRQHLLARQAMDRWLTRMVLEVIIARMSPTLPPRRRHRHKMRLATTRNERRELLPRTTLLATTITTTRRRI